ncbi:MAG: class I SAM-dependent methyltransferase [Terriglobia bacterium]
MEQVRRHATTASHPALDLGTGPGALAVRLRAMGLETTAADIDSSVYKADLPFVRIDLNHRDFASHWGGETFGLITAVEVLEHMESPINFLWNLARLLRRDGVAVVTTPNVDSVPARVRFFLAGKIRMMDEHSEPTHISPIFWDLFQRQYLPRAGLKLVDHLLFPPHGYQLTRPRHALALRPLKWLLGGECLEGDNHVFVLQPRG